MEFIISGLLLWSIVHLMPALTPSMRERLISRFGENTFKLIFTALIILSITLIVYGWRNSTTSIIYQPVLALKPLAITMLFFSFIFFASAIQPTRVLTFIRHPQLMFVLVWSLAHLILNGEFRSIVVFGCLGVWALLEILFINKRDGAWNKPDVPSLTQEIKGLILGIILFVLLIFGHGFISGIVLNF